MSVPILGRGIARIGVLRRFLAWRGCAFAVLHQPAGEHRRGVFFEPAIEQLRDLFPKIGGMAQPGQLVALQRIARSREKEFPRRLGLVFQGALQRDARANNNRLVNHVKVHSFSTPCGYVWKIFGWDCEQKTKEGAEATKKQQRRAEKRGTEVPPLEACSNCAGDYEDPERTAEQAEEENNETKEE
jgi:hypothetical protein